MGHQKGGRRCPKTGKFMFRTELDAKIVLAKLTWKGRDEKRIHPCPRSEGGCGHYHITSKKRGGRNRR